MNKELYKALKKKKEIIAKGVKLSKKNMEIATKLKDLEYELNEYKEIIINELRKEEEALGEYKEIRKAEVKGNDIVYEIVDVKEEYENGLDNFLNEYKEEKERANKEIDEAFAAFKEQTK